MREYLDFEVSISAPEGDRFPVSVRGPGGEEAIGWLTLPAADGDFGALLARMRRFDTDETSLTSIGQTLFDALFQGGIRDVYSSCMRDIDVDRGMRIRMNIDASASRAAELPWEFLYDSERGPLALLHTPVVRYLQQRDRLQSMAASLPLRVLLTAAQTGAPIDVEQELEAAAAGLAHLGDKVDLTIEPHLTVDKFQQLLRQSFHIWHFVGHGGFARDGVTGQLYFEAPNGDTHAISALQLGIMLNRSSLRLVVLNACSSAQIATDPFRSMAPALIRAQIPAVVAMQFAVPGETTNIFTEEFYETISTGMPLDACVTEARIKIMNTIGLSRPDWGIPVVYVRAADARLFEPATPQSAAPAAPPPTENQSIGVGIRVLRDLAQATGPVREAVASFSTDFHATSEQIELVSTYKDIHDQLHLLQHSCYNSIVTEIRRESADDIEWDNLLNYEMTLQGITEALNAISARSTQIGSDLTWVKEVTQSQTDLSAAIEGSDVTQLKRVARSINRVLNVQPTRINERLNAAARTLRLAALVQALTRVHEQLPPLGLDAEKIALVESAVLSIDQLEFAWPDIVERAAPLYAESAETWAVAVRSEVEKLATALQDKNPATIQRSFQRYRRQMDNRFFRVDVDLKRLCDDLRKIGAPLNALLRAIA
jgi:hypothetical protein